MGIGMRIGTGKGAWYMNMGSGTWTGTGTGTICIRLLILINCSTSSLSNWVDWSQVDGLVWIALESILGQHIDDLFLVCFWSTAVLVDIDVDDRPFIIAAGPRPFTIPPDFWLDVLCCVRVVDMVLLEGGRLMVTLEVDFRAVGLDFIWDSWSYINNYIEIGFEIISRCVTWLNSLSLFTLVGLDYKLV